MSRGKKAPTILLRPATVSDLPSVLTIEREAAVPTPWPDSWFRKELDRPRTRFLVATGADEETVLGFCVYWRLPDTLEILNIGVHPSVQRGGIGSFLLKAVLESAVSEKVLAVDLEVRDGNESALGLYLMHGFRVVGNRPGYYRDGATAVLMRRESIT